MRQRIPAPVLSVCADIAADHESHATMDTLFCYAGAPGDPPDGSKRKKALSWIYYFYFLSPEDYTLFFEVVRDQKYHGWKSSLMQQLTR